jgi:hypothetical protein
MTRCGLRRDVDPSVTPQPAGPPLWAAPLHGVVCPVLQIHPVPACPLPVSKCCTPRCPKHLRVGEETVVLNVAAALYDGHHSRHDRKFCASRAPAGQRSTGLAAIQPTRPLCRRGVVWRPQQPQHPVLRRPTAATLSRRHGARACEHRTCTPTAVSQPSVMSGASIRW